MNKKSFKNHLNISYLNFTSNKEIKTEAREKRHYT